MQRQMTIMTIVFGLGVAGVVASLGMAIFTVFHQQQVKEEMKTRPVALPAFGG